MTLYYGTMLQRYFVGHWSYDEKEGFGRTYVNFTNDSGRKMEYPPIKAVLCAWLETDEEKAQRFIHLPFEKLSALEKKIEKESRDNGHKQFMQYMKNKDKPRCDYNLLTALPRLSIITVEIKQGYLGGYCEPGYRGLFFKDN